jgi:Ca2+:H+ antiporter
VPLAFVIAAQILLLSRLTAVALLTVYIGYLIFQLGTHKDMFAEEEGEDTQQANMTLTAAGLWLGAITVVVAFLSEFLTGSIEEVRLRLPRSLVVHNCCLVAV